MSSLQVSLELSRWDFSASIAVFSKSDFQTISTVVSEDGSKTNEVDPQDSLSCTSILPTRDTLSYE